MQSLISPEVKYVQRNGIFQEDIGMDVDIYVVSQGQRKATVALGGAKNTYVQSGITFYPIYKIVGAKAVGQVGVFEVPTEDEIVGPAADPTDLGDPLIFDEDELFGATIAMKELEEESETDYVPKRNSTWVARFMESNDYSIQDNEGGGDCLFAVIRDGLEKIGRRLTVDEMRAKLAEAADEETFANYREISSAIKAEKARLSLEITKLSKLHKTLEKRSKMDSDLAAKERILAEARKTEAAHDRLMAERRLNAELGSEYDFMDGIDTLDKFKAAVQTCDFWADTWAISALEQALRIKMIVLSEDAYSQGDLANTLLCGQINHKRDAGQKAESPDAYIITSYGQSHYKLVTHRRRGAFSFAELPEGIKKLIVDKCLEKGAGPFSLIPEFRKLKGLEAAETSSDLKAQQGSVVFQVYDRSSGTNQPGKGAGEAVPDKRRKDFASLHRIKDWRRKLSPGWEQKFDLDGHGWQSVDHYVEAQKFKNTDPLFYKDFTMESASKLSKSSAMARAAGKNGKFEGKKVLPKGTIPDPAVSEKELDQARKVATVAKYDENPELANILSLTKDAQLNYFRRGEPPRRLVELEEYRK